MHSRKKYVEGHGFYDYSNAAALNAAGEIVPLVLTAIPIQSVLDVGCGSGAWLKILKEQHIQDYQGVDSYLRDPRKLLVGEDRIDMADFSEPFNLTRRFDLVTSIGLAGRLPDNVVDDFVTSLTQHSDVILFSPMSPNPTDAARESEKPLSYWFEKFEKQGFVMYDFIRPHIQYNNLISHWYRYNVVLFIRKTREVDARVARTVVLDKKAIKDYNPFMVKLRKRLAAAMPRGLRHVLIAIRNAFDAFFTKKQK